MAEHEDTTPADLPGSGATLAAAALGERVARTGENGEPALTESFLCPLGWYLFSHAPRWRPVSSNALFRPQRAH
jgi:hypothetical protein